MKMKKIVAGLLSLVIILSSVVLPITAGDTETTGPQLVYTVDFRGDDKFAPVALGVEGFDCSPSADGSSLTVAGKAGAADNTFNYWGGVINGLTADNTTVYTMIYKAKNNTGVKNNSIGIGGWIKDGDVTVNDGQLNYYNAYLNHNATDTPRAKLGFGKSDNGSYVNFDSTQMATFDQTDGFMTVKLIYNGATRKTSNYYLAAGQSGENEADWIKIDEQRFALDTTADAFGFVLYTYRPSVTDTTIKDVKIYKETVEAETPAPGVSPTEEDRTAVNVKGKTVTIDGMMDAAEGWAEKPFVNLNSVRSDPTKADGEEILTSNLSEVRLSYDADNIYIFFKTYQTEKSVIVFLLGFEDAKRGTKDNYVQIEVNTTETAKREEGSILPITKLVYDKTNGNYVAGDAFYDNSNVAVLVDETTNVTTVELALPIPDAAKMALLDDNYDKLSFGVWERFSATTNDGIVAADVTYAWNVGLLSYTMTKNESNEYQNLMDWIEAGKETSNHESLKDLTVNVLGDETLTGGNLIVSYQWMGMLDTKYGWAITNYAKKNMLIANHNSQPLLSLANTYRQMSANNPNLVIVNGGLNDYIKGAPIGTIDDTTDSTYMGALNTLIKGLRQKYPDACIVFTTGWNATNATTENTATYQAYADAMVQVCEARQVYCFKAYDTTASGVDMSSEEFRTTYCQAADDTLNLNLEGMKIVMPKYEAFIAESIAHWAANKETIMENQKDFINGGSSNNGGSTNNGGSSNNGANEETKAPETSAPATTTPTEKKGCGGVIGVGSAFAVLAIVSCAGVACFKKHDEE